MTLRKNIARAYEMIWRKEFMAIRRVQYVVPPDARVVRMSTCSIFSVER